MAMKLSNRLNERWKRGLASKLTILKYRKASDEAAKERNAAGKALYDIVMEPYKEAIKLLPHGFLDKQSTICLSLENNTKDFFYLEEALPVWENGCWHPFHQNKTFSSTDAEIVRYREAEKALASIAKEADDYRMKLLGTLAPYKTLKALLADWPELPELVPVEFQEFDTVTANLPSKQVIEFRKDFITPVKEEIPEAA